MVWFQLYDLGVRDSAAGQDISEIGQSSKSHKRFGTKYLCKFLSVLNDVPVFLYQSTDLRVSGVILGDHYRCLIGGLETVSSNSS